MPIDLPPTPAVEHVLDDTELAGTVAADHVTGDGHLHLHVGDEVRLASHVHLDA